MTLTLATKTWFKNTGATTVIPYKASGASTNVALSGGYSGGTPASLEASWQGGSYVPLTGGSITGGNWSGALASCARGTGTLTVRASDDHSAFVTTTLMVGESIGPFGDSTSVTAPGPSSPTSYNAMPVLGWYPAGNEWIDAQTVGASMWHWMYLVDQIRALMNCPVFVILGGVSGTKVTDWVPTKAPYDDFKAMIAASGINGITLFPGMLGPNSSHYHDSNTAAEMRAGYLATRTAFNIDYPGALVMASCMADRDPTPWAGDQGADTPDYIASVNGVKQGLIDSWDDGSIGVGANHTGLLYPDHSHPGSSEAPAVAHQFWPPVKQQLYGGTNPARGPRVVSRIQTGDSEITVLFDQDLANGDGSAVEGFRVFVNGSSVTVSSQVISGRAAVVTTAAPLSGTVTISFGSGEDAIDKVVPKGVALSMLDTTYASSVSVPAEPFFSRNVAPPTYTVGVRRM